jgi:retinol dehydrogenase-12
MSSSPRTVLVTGANTGIGAAAALQLAEPGVHLVLACRSEEKTRPVLEQVRARGAEASFLALDLADLRASTEAARAFVQRVGALHVLIDNAGLAGHRGLTKDGWELTFGTNHLGHFAFTVPLLPLLEASGGRVVLVSSGNHYKARGIDWAALCEPTKTRTGLREYGVSKLANVLFAAEIRRRHPKVDATSLNPGRIASDIWRGVPWPVRAWLPWLLRMKTVEQGGATLVNAARDARRGEALPLYFDKLAEREPNPLARDAALATKLWELSEDAVRAAVAAPARGREERAGAAATLGA